jgi:hypothetical protein
VTRPAVSAKSAKGKARARALPSRSRQGHAGPGPGIRKTTPLPAPGMRLHTLDGARKYLTAGERDAFLREAARGDRSARTLCMTLAYGDAQSHPLQVGNLGEIV